MRNDSIWMYLQFVFINLYLLRSSYALKKCFGVERICVSLGTSSNYHSEDGNLGELVSFSCKILLSFSFEVIHFP